MKNNRLQLLLKLLVDNTITEQELKELAVLMEQPGSEESIDAQLKQTWEETSSSTELNADLYQKITGHPRFKVLAPLTDDTNTPVKKLVKSWYYAAASILVLASIGLSIYFYQNDQQQIALQGGQLAKNVSEHKTDQNHVTLTLSNGKKVILDQVGNGKIGTDENVSITKNKDGQLVYDLSKVTDQGELAYNTISTPVGSNYQIILSDGTKVWLNAKSSLKFPAVFRSAERRVELSGEAYFEVAHNKKQPFFLTAKQMNIQVLGTHFNVAAYDDDQSVQASLLEGSIKASYQTSSLLLKPGQQALLSNNAAVLTQRSFDADEVMDWKNGFFIFRNEPIDEIMKKVSRWYHIEVNYQGMITKEAFGGKYLKSNSLAELLSSLELTGTVKFKIEGRRVTVMQ